MDTGDRRVISTSEHRILSVSSNGREDDYGYKLFDVVVMLCKEGAWETKTITMSADEIRELADLIR